MKQHCCSDMEDNLKFDCKIHKDKYECADALISYSSKFDEYGLLIHDGGTSSISINYCPWCGKKLPDSKRDRWFEELEKLGFNNPFEENIPKKFKDDSWYKAIKES
ncbi:hypothetical protein KKA17_07085 [bacterium]|nr:hypothetical protein [bacterium]